jgi:GTPase SAR1 family protein
VADLTWFACCSTPVDIPTLLKEALKEGTKEWRRSKLSIVGEGRAGKTALTNTIIGRGFSETNSTVGINQLTCDVRQVRASASGQDEAEWSVAHRSERELETALAQMVAEQKRRHAQGRGKLKASSALDIRSYLKEQDEGRRHRVDREAVQEHLFKTAAAPATLQPSKPAAASAVTSGGAWAPKQHGSATAAAPVVGAWTPKKKAEYESAPAPVHVSTSDPDIHGMGILGHGLSGLFAHKEDGGLHSSSHREISSGPTSLQEGADEGMVMKALANIQDDDSGLMISLFDFGGQSVFDVIHHLFLTRNGVYALVFNMEWLVTEGPAKDKALRFMRNWLSSVAVHTYDKVTNTTAPIVFVGTRLDLISSPAKHAAISTLLYEQFSDNLAWRSVLENENGHDANGKAFQWFFPVDNKLGKKGPTMKNLMSVVHDAMEGAAYTHKEVPLAWFKVMDRMADAKKDCLTLTEVNAIGARSQVSAAEMPYLLGFLHDMGHLMWIDEPDLRDVVVLDPVSYLVTPATVIICKITPDKDDPTHHFMAAHRECERMHKREWMLLKQDGVLHVSLLPILWKDYLKHKDVLLQLMVKFGLLVPLRTAAIVKGASLGEAAPPVMQYLVPTLLSATPTNDLNLLRWTEAPYSSCYFVFTLLEELSQSTTISVSDLRSSGFLPGGMFERIVGKALSWSQDTAKGSGINLQSVLLFKDMATLTFGGQRFRLVNCADIHCVRVDVEGSNPLGIQQKLQDFFSRIIDECMKSLRCFAAVRYSSDAQDRDPPTDPLRKQLLSSELLIPLSQLRSAAKGESVLAWRGGRTLLATAEIKSRYDQWLQLYELRDRYDVFISYRWGAHDSDLTEALFDMFTNFVVGADKRAMHVFLDRKRLQDGRRFKVDLASGLTHSLIILPIVSVDALKRMLEHTAETIDNVLLEWIMTLECIAAKRVLKVFPVLFGARVTDLRVGGVKVLDFFLDRTKDNLPKVVPRATLEQCRELLLANGVQPSAAFNSYTVHSVVFEMLQFLLCKASDLDPSQVVEVVADKVVALLQDCGPEAMALVAGNTHSDTLPAGAAPLSTVVPAAPAALVAAVSAIPATTAAGVSRKLEDLTVDEVCVLVEKVGLKKLVDVLRSKEVTGAMLSYCEDISELQDEAYGVSNTALARGLLKHIKEWVATGVVL